ncbi:MAG: hypothetical protein A3A86_08385 [Elusimicrobia bacterium RIFCSPLOWO2_01_FULL_60_11]|nr:MAG: hypothetical protein A3A86_08385 [Elusimicrobia bacterium RIFCSPLOWO2_01_FULL_60_11]
MNIKKIAAVLILAGLAAAGFYAWKSPRHAGHETAPVNKIIYHCPMHPTYTSDKPGDCPICGMKLVQVTEDQHEAATPETGPDAGAAEMPAGRVPIVLSQERQQLIGVRTATVTLRNLETLVRASGRVAYDPDLYNAIVEHIEALKAKEAVKESPLPDSHERSAALIRSSALRLRQMGLSQEQIDRLSRKTKNPTNLLLGENNESMWVYAQIYAYEAGLVKSGQMMEVTSSADPGRTLRGKVVAVDTRLDPETRTLRVRGEIPNPEGLLKPEMFVDVVIRVDLGEKLAVPKEAVLDSGTRKILFVEETPGRYAPREIQVGREAEGHYEIIAGLKAGEKVVVSANFFIDSESRLKSSLSQSGAGHSH